MSKKTNTDIANRRGYYSESITKKSSSDEDSEGDRYKDVNPGACKRTKLLWQVRTERHAPVIQELPITLKPCFLAPAERWMTYSDEKCIVSIILSRITCVLLYISCSTDRY